MFHFEKKEAVQDGRWCKVKVRAPRTAAANTIARVPSHPSKKKKKSARESPRMTPPQQAPRRGGRSAELALEEAMRQSMRK